jgi:hypothetical protein
VAAALGSTREYQVISQWFGGLPPSQTDRRINSIRIEPALLKLRPGTRQQAIQRRAPAFHKPRYGHVIEVEPIETLVKKGRVR